MPVVATPANGPRLMQTCSAEVIKPFIQVLLERLETRVMVADGHFDCHAAVVFGSLTISSPLKSLSQAVISVCGIGVKFDISLEDGNRLFEIPSHEP